MKDKLVALVLMTGLLSGCKPSEEEKQQQEESLIASLSAEQKEEIAFNHDVMLAKLLDSGFSLSGAFKSAAQLAPQVVQEPEKDKAVQCFLKKHANMRFNQAIHTVTDYVNTPMPDGRGGIEMQVTLQTRYLYQPDFPEKLRLELLPKMRARGLNFATIKNYSDGRQR